MKTLLIKSFIIHALNPVAPATRNIRPKAIADTLSMARAIHGTEVGNSLKKLAVHYKLGQKGEEVLNAVDKFRCDFTPEQLARYGEYCCNDTEICRELHNILLPKVPVLELKQIDMIIRMFTEPQFVGDVAMLEQQYKTVSSSRIN